MSAPDTRLDGAAADEGLPRIYALNLVKDEADIIGLCLRHASRFCTKIFVLDNGSTDGTWEILQDLAGELPAVELLGRKEELFAQGFRALMFDRTRHVYQPGDWVLVLDSDEFLQTDPRPYLRDHVSPEIECIELFFAQFYVTHGDLGTDWFEQGPTPIGSFEELPRHFRIDHAERRLIRYRHDLEWPIRNEDGAYRQLGFPVNIRRKIRPGLVARHYQYRSREQMQRRVRQRARVGRKTGRFGHSRDPDWRPYVQEARELRFAGPGHRIEVTARERLNVWLKRDARHLVRRARRVSSRLVPWLSADAGAES